MMINAYTNFPFKDNLNIISYWLNYFVSVFNWTKNFFSFYYFLETFVNIYYINFKTK